MKLVEMNWTPSPRELRQFGVIALVALPLLGWMWGAGTTLLIILGVSGGLLAVLGLVAPPLVKPVYVGLCLITLPIGLVVGEVLMAVVFYGVFLPIGLVFKLIGRDGLELQIDRGCKSYWSAKKQPANAASYFQQW